MAGKQEAVMQRAGVFAEVPALLRELGVDPLALYRNTGIDPDSLQASDMIPFRSILTVMDRAAHATASPHIGLLLGQRFDLAHHGLIGRLMRRAPTLQQALDDFVSWQPGYSSGAIVYLIRRGDEFAFGYGTHDQVSPGILQLYDAVVTIGLRMLHELSAGQARPDEIRFSRRTPEDLAVYNRLLKAPLRFDQHQTCIILNARAMGIRLPGSDPAMRREALGEVHAAIGNVLGQTSARVRQALRPLLHAGKDSMPEAAEKLGLHPRTLRRRLAAEGLTFRGLRDDLRFSIACELLEMTDLPITDISEAVAAASPGNLTSAFRRWSGMTPSEWRRRRPH